MMKCQLYFKLISNLICSVTMSISNTFIPYFVCGLTNERYKTYQTGFIFCCLGHALGMGLCGTGFFFQTYQIDGDDEQNIMQVAFLS